MFSKKATEFDEMFTIDLTICCKCQIDSEDFVNFCGLLRKHELYVNFFKPVRELLEEIFKFLSIHYK